jgi:hypothetical protein
MAAAGGGLNAKKGLLGARVVFVATAFSTLS